MKALALLFLSVSLCLSADLPTFHDLPGHLVPNQCDPFAKAAVLKLHKQGIPAVRLTFGWQNPQGRGFHAALAFMHEGRVYAMDNEHRAPVLVKGKTDLSCAIRLSGGLDFYTAVWMTNEYNKKVAPRKLTDLFKPGPTWLENNRIDRFDKR